MRIYHGIASVSLPPEQLDFIKHNTAFWERCLPQSQTSKAAEYVLVFDERQPIISFCNASFASIVAQTKNLQLLFVRSSLNNTVEQINLNDERTQILKSYPNSKFFFYMRGWRCWLMKVSAKRAAAKAYHSIKTPKDLLKFKVDGVHFGDLVYDAVLTEGYATINVIDDRVLRRLQQLYFFRACIKRIIKKYDIKTSVFAHTVGLASGTFSRCLLEYGIEVLHRVGANQIVIKKYRNLEDVGVYAGKLERKYFDMMMNHDNGTIIETVEKHLDRRFNHELCDRDASFAFDHTKKTFTDKNSFCAEYDLDNTKPIVFVMLHAFNDFPHSHFKNGMIFQDYFHWVMHTLKTAQTVESANWIFKEHPSAIYYPHRDIDLKEIFDQAKANHIRFLAHEKSFNARSVRYLAHAVITCIGTAGLENATFGIPCILGGKSFYSDFGFAIEPEDIKEYERCLRNISQLPKLNQQQIKAAKVVSYFNFCLYNDAVNNSFCPQFDVSELKEWNNELSSELWRRAAEQFQDKRHVEAMISQAQEISRFVSDSSWTQCFDMRQLKAEGIL
jgi:hypothetical protein